MICHELLGPDPRQSSCQEWLGVVRSCQDPARDSRFAMSRQEFSGPDPRQASSQESLDILRTRNEVLQLCSSRLGSYSEPHVNRWTKKHEVPAPPYKSTYLPTVMFLKVFCECVPHIHA